MKKNTNNQIKLGIFVTIAIVLFVLGIYFIGRKQQLFTSTFTIKTVFKDVGGLQVGNNVRFAGISVGIVDDIQILNDTSVCITMVVDEDVHKFIKKDSRANIGSEGLMGNKLVSLSQGLAKEPIKENEFVIASTGASMDEVMESLKTTSSNAASITTDLAKIVGQVRNGHGAIGKLFMDTVFAENLDQTLINVKQGAGGFKRNMDAASNSFLLRGLVKKTDKEKAKEQEKEDKIKEEKEQMKQKEKELKEREKALKKLEKAK